MNEQLIRKQTAVLLDAYRELTGSTEIPNIEDFLKLRDAAEAAIHKTANHSQNTEITVCKNNICSQGVSVSRKVQNPTPEKEVRPKPQEPLKTVKTQPEFQMEDSSLSEDTSTSSAFEVLRNIKDPWNS